LHAEGDVLGSTGDTFGSLGKYTEAKAIFERIVRSDIRASSPELHAEALWDLGRIFEGRAEFGDALARYQSALKHLEGLPDSAISFLKPGLLTSKGLLLLYLARYDDASTDFLAAAAVCKSVGNWEGEAFALASLGETARWASNFHEAELYNQQALAVYKDHGQERGTILPQIRVLANLIELASISGLVLDEAANKLLLGYMKQGMSLLEQYEKPLNAREIIDVLYAAKDTFRAERYDQHMKEVFERDDEWLKKWPAQSPEFFQGD
jgi:tetratricopeptide (TPR) repeat protein